MAAGGAAFYDEFGEPPADEFEEFIDAFDMASETFALRVRVIAADADGFGCSRL